ncbi:NarL family two-component system response regulator LiaR [Solibacillus kalamii]|uniref:Response regulator containing a CheY-like receiver domain and an HTH DNA-binding domain n=2 Tax=Solibacillus TaxID=648800 RepID=F2FAS7_SOLSS|nr:MULTISPECIES: response regulator transcription factor [Solibacillus]MBM7666444.1 NarL family two-component system response regulator LiaR [Solibacillus kalamii]OUZ37964.1 DNA-binding response regulator [Solibacillus kalamii]BAK17243.1 response regulator containing a CheY-like receiver domain and an HTH DNA-binding domain [Solibacillus silvestris StLB046]
MIKVVIVDDHEMVRIGVAAYLSAQPDIEVIGEATNGEEAIDKVLALKPDIVLMDNVMPIKTGAEATAEILAQWPQAKVMIVTSFIDDDKLYPALEAGAVSYILKTSNAKQIADAIRKTMDGETVLEPEATTRVMARMRGTAPALHNHLTDREMEVLLCMARGLANQEIAEELFIALKTVKTHVSNILSKLEVQDRTQAVVYAFQNGLVK